MQDKYPGHTYKNGSPVGDVEPRGSIGRMERLPTLRIEGVHDFTCGMRTFLNKHSRKLVTRADKLIQDSISYREIYEWKRGAFTAMSIHNLYVLVDCINRIKEVMNHHDDLINQIVGDEKFRLLKSIDEMVKSDSPMDVYNKYKPLYLKYSNPRKEEQKQTNKFF